MALGRHTSVEAASRVGGVRVHTWPSPRRTSITAAGTQPTMPQQEVRTVVVTERGVVTAERGDFIAVRGVDVKERGVFAAAADTNLVGVAQAEPQTPLPSLLAGVGFRHADVGSL